MLPKRIADRINTAGPFPSRPHTPVEGRCWTYKGWHNSAGYPYTRWNGRDVPVHRVVYEALTGADITGLDLDHLCRNPGCVNPAHHEPVTHAENQRRIAKMQNECRRAGHDWSDPRNVRVRPNGARYCAECDRIDQRHRRREREAS